MREVSWWLEAVANTIREPSNTAGHRLRTVSGPIRAIASQDWGGSTSHLWWSLIRDQLGREWLENDGADIRSVLAPEVWWAIHGRFTRKNIRLASILLHGASVFTASWRTLCFTRLWQVYTIPLRLLKISRLASKKPRWGSKPENM